MRFYPEAHELHNAMVAARPDPRGAKPLEVSAIHAIIHAKLWRQTDMQAAAAAGCSIASVRKYSAAIFGPRRWNMFDAMNRRTGEVVPMSLFRCKL